MRTPSRNIFSLSVVGLVVNGCWSDPAVNSTVLETARIGNVCLTTVELKSPKVPDPCRFMATFVSNDACVLSQVVMGNGKSIENYFRGPFTIDASVEYLWRERERIRHEPFFGPIGLSISGGTLHACAYADALSSPHIPTHSLRFSEILGPASTPAAESVQLRFMVRSDTLPTLEMYTTVDRVISASDARLMTARMAEHLGLKDGSLDVFFSLRPWYFDGGHFPLFNPLFDSGEVSLNKAKRTTFMMCDTSKCLGSLIRR
jgi:hypothetical protein